MNTVAKSTSLAALGLSSGDHWVKFHVNGDSISFEVAASAPQPMTVEPDSLARPTGFVQRWGGSARKLEDGDDAWLAHINDKHLR